MPIRANVPFYQAIVRPQPALGQELTLPNSGKFIVRHVSATFTLTTDATVATRAVTVELTDGTNALFRAGASFTQPASTTYKYSIMSGGSDFGDVNSVIHIPTPHTGLIILPGWVARTVTTNLQAGDQFGQLGVLAEMFENGPYFEWVPTVDRAVYEKGL